METTTTTTSESAESNPPTVVVPVVTTQTPPAESTETLVNLAQQIERNQAEFQTTMTTFRSEMADIRNLVSETAARMASFESAAEESEEIAEVVEVEPTPLPKSESPVATPKSKRHPVLAVFLGRLP